MSASNRREHDMLRAFFKIHPDYSLCRTLAANIMEGFVTHEHALQLLTSKASQTAALRDSIQASLDKKKIMIEEVGYLLKDLTLDQIIALDDQRFADVLHFYFKYPRAHNRISRPSWFRRRAKRLQFLSALMEESKRRSLSTDYLAWEDLLSLI
ncbi:MAG: hypothetical protein HYR55_16695 [Acidobacteria bacterium]|nr:hypothetical protein [Acidobacteriota bacterium]MBI3657424.1 hypothetical protein [Acidobacteriota bacterium]